MAKIVAHLKRVAPSVPVILFTKNGGQHLEVMAETGCAALGLDWTTDLASARARVGDRVALQGNLDPAIPFASPAMIEPAVASVRASYGNGAGHVFNHGSGILTHTPPDQTEVMIERGGN